MEIPKGNFISVAGKVTIYQTYTEIKLRPRKKMLLFFFSSNNIMLFFIS